MSLILEAIVMFVAVEAITEIIVDGDIFFKIRNFLARINPWFLGELLKCGYCLSVWVAIPFGLAIGVKYVMTYTEYTNLLKLLHLNNEICNYYYIIVLCVAFVFFTHRISNVIHESFKRFFDRYPFVLLHQQVNMSDTPEAPDVAKEQAKTQESTTETQDDTMEKSDGSADTPVHDQGKGS